MRSDLKLSKFKCARLFPVWIALLLAGCAQQTPSHIENLCDIFYEYPEWYWDLKDISKDTGVPAPVIMAIMHQESRFVADAKPPRKKLFSAIPYRRISSAYGYSQALDGTWRHYQITSGRYHASRTDFKESAEFVAWFCVQSHRQFHIPLNDARRLYLVYHEGAQGYRFHSYARKPWLGAIAGRVQQHANVYQKQLGQCSCKIKKPWWQDVLASQHLLN